MLINEVCKECGLTKKAIEYYEKQRLVQPQVLNNGYRDFSSSDMEKLKKTAVLRQLGLSVADIQTVLNDKSKSEPESVLKQALDHVSAKKTLELETMKSKQELLQKLAQNHDWEYTRSQLEILERKQAISERLLNVFPGHYGQYVSLHFGFYLNEPIATKEQQEAFDTVISFLDGVALTIPVDLQEYLDEAAKNFDSGFAVNVSDSMNQAVQNPEQYIADNRETLEWYMAFKQSDEYRKSPACKLQTFFAAFNRESGYDDILIPAMKKLSRTYRDYHEALQRANEVFMERYPDYCRQKNPAAEQSHV